MVWAILDSQLQYNQCNIFFWMNNTNTSKNKQTKKNEVRFIILVETETEPSTGFKWKWCLVYSERLTELNL